MLKLADFRWIAAGLCLCGAACAHTSAPPPQAGPAAQAAPAADAEPPAVAVTVMRAGAEWTAEFTFNQSAPVWAFRHSALLRDSRTSWRPAQLQITTPGIMLDHVGGRDVLRTESGGPLPRNIHAELHPASVGVEASYNPALVFSDGAVALFSDQFDLIPVPSLEMAEALPPDITQSGLPAPDVEVTWQDVSGPVLFHGQRIEAPSGRAMDTYVLFGTPAAVETERFAVIADAALPPPVRDVMMTATPALIGLYADKTGLVPPAHPMVMASWKGATPGLRSMGGSVMHGLIAIVFEGEGVAIPSEELNQSLKLFLAHEAAHFWLGQIVNYEREADMWITEGGAELMAARALEITDPDFPVRDFLQKAVDDCADLAARGAIISAGQRGEHRAFYACGTVFAMVAEGHARRSGQEGWLDVVADIIRSNLDDRIISRPEWLAHLETLSGSPLAGASMVRLLDEDTAAASTLLSEMLAGAGVGHTLQGGRILLE